MRPCMIIDRNPKAHGQAISRPLCFLMLAVSLSLVVASPALAADDAQSTRTWTTKAGTYTLEARYVSQDESSVKLAKDDGTEVEVVKNRLCTKDNQWLTMTYFKEQDQACDQQCQPLRDQLTQDQASCTGALIALHNQFKQSPIAGLLAAVSCSAIDNDPKKAVTLLNESMRRITVQRELMPSAHRDTLVSVLNDLAVCEVKLGKPSPAANHLLTALKESGPNTNGAVFHNARLLLDAASTAGARIKIKTEIASDLRLRATQAIPRSEVHGFDQLLVFSTQTSDPYSGTGDAQNFAADGFVPNLWCLTCSGRGFLPCVNPKCSGGGIVVKERVVVGQNHLGVPVSGEKVNRIRCEVCNGAGGRPCRHCVEGKVRQ